MNLRLIMQNNNIKKFITSDLHFWHNGILSLQPEKRHNITEIKEMNEYIINEWNTLISNDDVIFFLGDFSFKGRFETEKILKRLNGIKIMILGNHDKKLKSLYEKYFIIVTDYLEVNYNETKICMMHYPISCWNRAGHGSIMLHGHSHGNFKGVGRIMDIGYDSIGHIAELDEIYSLVMSKEVEVLDHH